MFVQVKIFRKSRSLKVRTLLHKYQLMKPTLKKTNHDELAILELSYKCTDLEADPKKNC
jgi:hypothetical protein